MTDTLEKTKAGITTVDPATFQIVTSAMVAITREMGLILRRSSRSTIIREAQDFSNAILDVGGNLVAQSEAIPIHLNSLGMALSFCLRDFPPETLGPEDALLTNDPYLGGGQHLPDTQLFMPVFYRGRLVSFVGNLAHMTDVSGGIGSLNPSAVDIYQEGLRIPPVKLRMPEDLETGNVGRLLRANSREPAKLVADLNAQRAAALTGRQRLIDLFDKHGLDTVLACMEGALDYSERRTREVLAALPDGVYEGEDFLDTDAFSDVSLRVFARVTVKEDTIHIDFTGTDPQARGFVNSTYGSTFSAVYTAVKTIIGDPTIPTNAGCFRPVSIHIPLGTVLNPHPPAPIRLRMNACCRAYGAVMRAFGKIAPERAAASGFDTTTCVNLGRLGPEGFRIFMEPIRGGYGGTNSCDGVAAISQIMSNSRNTPVEAAETDFDFFRVRRYGMLPDSGGHGRHRGGLGCVREYEITRDDVFMAFSSDRNTLRPWAFGEGGEGTTGKIELIREGSARRLPSNGTSMTLNRGDRLLVETGGGGGYDAPAERDPELVRQDLRRGLISEQAAREVYGLGNERGGS